MMFAFRQEMGFIGDTQNQYHADACSCGFHCRGPPGCDDTGCRDRQLEGA